MLWRPADRWGTSFGLAILLAFALAAPGLPQDSGDACDFETTERVVAIADVHGAANDEDRRDPLASTFGGGRGD